jgi:hypothetical protein
MITSKINKTRIAVVEVNPPPNPPISLIVIPPLFLRYSIGYAYLTYLLG